MKKIILSSILGLAIIVSCEKKQDEQAENNKTTTEQKVSDDHATDNHEKLDEHKEGVKLELNNGAKWTMNAEMKPFINEMEIQINAYKPENGDYKMLATNLSATNDNLLKSCTIKGTPHDVLHSWLMPHMEEIDKLKKATDREEANHIVKELKESMEKYHKYFD
ncbi:hypothetical protein [Kaistella jeonii]|uniref:hypothetical protein n=1 Tax=Kaistella jeonii TaxID=266749 RepID=UPI00068A7655|nr:hypothetical protein [Kaistella jeonii]SFC33770.1 hypothetical protein SAMN05421876_11456 [Kaistella jeonii]VEI95510.1 Uncharacterised protein [Kaistella jeonii]